MGRAAPSRVAGRRVTPIVAYLATGLIGVSLCAVSIVQALSHQPATHDFGAPVASSVGARAITDHHAIAPSPLSRHPTPRGPASPPTRIQIPALHVAAMIIRVSSVNGTLGVPDDPMTVGWWGGAAEPGSLSGSVVFDGHVDSATRGLGAFFHLTSLHAGDLITVTTLRGSRLSYRVTARRTYDKQAGLPADLFAARGPARLVLITCGGSFDTTTLSYRDNIVVLAVPTT